MKKMFKRTTAIAASALMIGQMVPFNVFADPGPNDNSLIIHPYLLTDSNYDTAKKADYDPTGTLADQTTARSYGSDAEANILFDVVQVDVNGQPLDGGYSSPAAGKEFEHLPNGYYKVTPNSASANNLNQTDPNFIDAQAFFVQLPSGATGSNNYAVHVYPKLTDNNDTDEDTTDPSTSDDKHSIKLTKTLSDPNDTWGLGGVGEAVFDIWYKDALGNWENAAPDEGYSTKNGILKVDGLPFGTYYAVERTAPNGYLLDQTPVVFTLDGTDDADQVADFKNDKELTATKVIDKDGGGHTYNWTITADVPSKVENLLSYTITDTYTATLGNVRVVSVSGLTPTAHYTVDDSITGKIVITLTADGIAELAGQTSIEVKISSELGTYSSGDVTNSASIDYKYAFNPDDHDDDPDGPDVIPDDIPDPDDPNNDPAYPSEISYPGPGDPVVEDSFVPTTIILSNVDVGGTELTDGAYEVPNCSPYRDDTDLSTDTVSVLNMAPGKYTITQTATKSGYLIDSPKTIFIDTEGNVYLGEDANGTPLPDKTVVFVNEKTATGFELPFTGSTATIVFTIAGIGVMGGALFFFIFFKKRDKDEEDQENA
jgi:fimbrial isopeptide formation D2 family protein/LPXTG-motif cell wall-anchored protein